ncbi:uncharacterized protein LOC126721222 [Quercus robur]|uniref:uncharacterized protein LOC126721222 n=1 Tax=Quercus robur TaxID=38942 RepID=UPI0021623829|nr:uncharacterized protein LOC126721222 [Quercus robur]
MSCLAWNCHGLGNLLTGRELVDIIPAKDPSIVFLIETLTDEARLDIVQRNIDFDHQWVVPRKGRGGGYVGPKFTWCRNFKNGTSIWERFDRGLATNDWFLKFPGSKVHHLQCDSSDHCPLLVVLAPLDISSRKKPFWFEEMWLSNPRCGEIVQAAWNQGFGVEMDREILVEKCGKDLIWWNKNVFGSVKKDLVWKKQLLIRVESEALLNGNNSRVRQLKSEINELLDREARVWAQRSRLLWANQGDKNTKYFHNCATKRFRKNQIVKIRDKQHVWRYNPEEISLVVTNYYEDLFHLARLDQSNGVLDHVPQLITEEMNASLR